MKMNIQRRYLLNFILCCNTFKHQNSIGEGFRLWEKNLNLQWWCSSFWLYTNPLHCVFPKQIWQAAHMFVFLSICHCPSLIQRHPLLKGGYTGHEKMYSGDVNISPRLAETKWNQQFLEKSVLPIFPGRLRFWLFYLLNPGKSPPAPPLVHAAATRRGGGGGESPGFSRKNR